MKEHRGVFRRLAGVGVIMLAIDVAGMTMMAPPSSSEAFAPIGSSIKVESPPAETNELGPQVKAIAGLIIGIGIGVALFAWGASASRKLEQESREAQAKEQNPPATGGEAV